MSERKINVMLTLDPRELEQFDKLRGFQSRSSTVRDLIKEFNDKKLKEKEKE